MAKKLTRIDGSGALVQAGFSAQDLGLFIDLLYQNGGFLYGENGVTWGEAAGREAMITFNSLLHSGTSDTPTQPLSGSFEGGQAAMRYNWTWYGAFLQHSEVQWDVAFLPTSTGENLPARGRNNYEVGLAVLATTSPHKQRLAFEFIKWLWDDDEFVIRDNETLGRVPGKVDLWHLPEIQEHKVMRKLAMQAPYTVYAGPIPGWTWDALGKMYDDVLHQRMDPLLALENSVDVGNGLFGETPPKWIAERRYNPRRNDVCRTIIISQARSVIKEVGGDACLFSLHSLIEPPDPNYPSCRAQVENGVPDGTPFGGGGWKEESTLPPARRRSPAPGLVASGGRSEGRFCRRGFRCKKYPTRDRRRR